MILFIKIFGIITIFLLSSIFKPVFAQTSYPQIHLGVMGDSGADEYRADDFRGGSYGSTTLNWVEQMVKSRGFDLGVWSNSSRGEPRREGFEFNWARSGATSYTLLSLGEHTGLAQQIAQKKINTVILQIGVNDFSYQCYTDPLGHSFCGIFEDIYYRRLTGTALTNKLNEITSNIKQAIDTVLTASINSNNPIQLIVGSVNDRSLVPYAIQNYPNSSQRQLVSNAIQTVNTDIQNYSQVKNFTFIDLNTFGSLLLSKLINNRYYQICQELIDFAVSGDEPHHMMIGDDEHAGTVMEGLLANYYLSVFQTPITLMSDWDILQNAGITPTNPYLCPGYLSPTPTPSQVKPGDADRNGLVDRWDYVIWSNNYGAQVFGTTNGDFDNDNSVNGIDYVIWLNNYGK